MRLLALSTSGVCASAALADADRVDMLCGGEELTHSETIMPLVDTLLDKNGVCIKDIDYFAVDEGPGSFTGVRIGVCAVNAMAAVCRKAVAGVSSLQALAVSVGGCASVCALLDARNGNVYGAYYENGQCITEPCSQSAKAFLEHIPAGTLFVGDGASVYRELINAAVPGARFAQENRLFANSVALAAKQVITDGATVQEALPMYLRPPQAQRLYKSGTPDVTFRDMRIEDVPRVAELERLCFRSPWSEDALMGEVKNSIACYRLAVVDGKTVGYAGMWLMLGEAHITNVAIDPGYRRLGLGKKLMEHMMQTAVTRRARSMTLEVRDSNTSAQNLYYSLGFEKAGTRRHYYSDTGENAWILWNRHIASLVDTDLSKC